MKGTSTLGGVCYFSQLLILCEASYVNLYWAYSAKRSPGIWAVRGTAKIGPSSCADIHVTKGTEGVLLAQQVSYVFFGGEGGVNGSLRV